MPRFRATPEDQSLSTDNLEQAPGASERSLPVPERSPSSSHRTALMTNVTTVNLFFPEAADKLPPHPITRRASHHAFFYSTLTNEPPIRPHVPELHPRFGTATMFVSGIPNRVLRCFPPLHIVLTGSLFFVNSGYICRRSAGSQKSLRACMPWRVSKATLLTSGQNLRINSKEMKGHACTYLLYLPPASRLLPVEISTNAAAKKYLPISRRVIAAPAVRKITTIATRR